ncbi:MAG TPA: aminotransferase class I/II-fold pyridoxal phosphate-dependent enzyme [Solirubrobacteraceae bacterium]|jgi:2-aminoadipate transaminase|nr:aminotransferase class I/II-fold pyridoxal phosphate-dependent enzyme [Solirubrobacteraceae bacterium]
MDDRELTRTLQELERKLGELEGALKSIAASPPAAGGDAHAGTPPEPEPAPSFGRIVDESLEPAEQSPGAAATSEPAPAPEQRPAPPAAVATPPPAPSPPRLGVRRAGAPPTARTPPPHTKPEASSPFRNPSPAAASPSRPGPGPAELLRFRERLERAGRELTHEYDELLGRLSYAAVPSTTGPTISFARGVPSLDIIDVDGLKEAAVRAFESDPEGTTAYGTAIGYPRLRAWIADRHGVEPERVMVTNGSLQADAFLFDHLVHPGDEVIVESPTYDRTLLGLRERGAQVHAVELEADGIDTAALQRLLDGGARPKLAHVIPNFQNPAGYTLSVQKRRALLDLAAQHDFIILEDDPYAELRFAGEPVPTMLSIDPERVVYASSFTKTVAPGVRVGYLVGPTALIAELIKRATNTYISPNMVSESLVYEFCASGAIEGSIETVKRALAERARTLTEALRSELPEAEFVEPQGGYFLWVTLPEGTDVDRLFDAAAERGVTFVKGTDFLLEGGENTLRLAYSGVTPEQIEEGVRRLAAAYRSL